MYFTPKNVSYVARLLICGAAVRNVKYFYKVITPLHVINTVKPTQATTCIRRSPVINNQSIPPEVPPGLREHLC